MHVFLGVPYKRTLAQTGHATNAGLLARVRAHSHAIVGSPSRGEMIKLEEGDNVVVFADCL